MKHYDYLIIGSGLFGATFAYRATQAGKRCLVLEKRSHVGGNLYCENVNGIPVHTYGAHIFHTSNKSVWDFVNSIVPFNRFTNSPLAYYAGKYYNLPFNMNTFYQMWGVATPSEAMQKIEQQRAQARKIIGEREPRNLEEQALLLVGQDIYEKLIQGYTEKQWGRPCTQLPAFIIRRLPVRMTYDNNYFNDAYQGIPIGGYNLLINKLLQGEEVQINTDFLNETEPINRANWSNFAHQLVFTGQLDAFYDYRFGHLQYRTVRFETETLPTANYQGNAVINYTEASIPYTRIIEHKHFEYFGADVETIPTTVISREYSTEWQPGMEPYYPINDEHNTLIANQYRQLAQAEKDIIFGGRLAEYAYYDMAPIVEKVLNLDI